MFKMSKGHLKKEKVTHTPYATPLPKKTKTTTNRTFQNFPDIETSNRFSALTTPPLSKTKKK